jgi:hypothetical protein
MLASDPETKETLVGGEYQVTSVPTAGSYRQVFDAYYRNVRDGLDRSKTFSAQMANAIFNCPYTGFDVPCEQSFEGKRRNEGQEGEIIKFRGYVREQRQVYQLD